MNNHYSIMMNMQMMGMRMQMCMDFVVNHPDVNESIMKRQVFLDKRR